MCIYICVYIYIYLNIYIFIYIYIHIHIYIYIISRKTILDIPSRFAHIRRPSTTSTKSIHIAPLMHGCRGCCCVRPGVRRPKFVRYLGHWSLLIIGNQSTLGEDWDIDSDTIIKREPIKIGAPFAAAEGTKVKGATTAEQLGAAIKNIQHRSPKKKDNTGDLYKDIFESSTSASTVAQHGNLCKSYINVSLSGRLFLRTPVFLRVTKTPAARPSNSNSSAWSSLENIPERPSTSFRGLRSSRNMFISK